MNKKKLVSVAVAVIFAVTIVIGGGTLAYLTGASVGVTNQAEKNFNWVSISETGADDDGSGNLLNTSYEIVPGTSQDKDPTVSVSYSVESYVFVAVTDTSGGEIFDYDIADGWTKLTSTTDTDGSVTTVYYRLATLGESGATEAQESGVTYYKNSYSVLENDEISYKTSITNSTLVESFSETGDPTFYDDDVYKLVFQAYICQAVLEEDYADPLDAYYLASTGSSYYVAGATYVLLSSTTSSELATELVSAISEADGPVVVVLPESSSVSVSTTSLNSALSSSASTEVYIDLSQNTMTLTGSTAVTVSDGNELTLTNGTLAETTVLASTNYVLYAAAGSTLTLDNMTVESDSFDASVVYVEGNAAEVNIIDSEISTSGVYCVATNASDLTAHSGVIINIDGSTLTTTSSDGDNCAVCLNVYGTLNITDSTITGDRQGVFVRGGVANISNSTITTTNSYTGDNRETRQTGSWSSGNEAAIAALVVGNNGNGGYPTYATVTLDNVTLKVGEATESAGINDAPQIYTISTSTYSTTVNIIGSEGLYDIDSITASNVNTTINYASVYVPSATYVTAAAVTSGDGSSELAAALSAAAEAISAGSTEEAVVVLSEGSYSLEDTATIAAGTTIAGAGTSETTLAIDCDSGDGYTISSENVTLSNLSIVASDMGTSYGNSAINITASGVVLDNVYITGGTKATYTASIYINGGSDADFTFTIKNSTIDNSSMAPFRGLFVENLAGTLYIDNCTIDSVYPMNIMSASTTAEVYFTDCALHGWTSYTSNVNKVTFTNCTFSKGSGANTYDNVAAYTDTVFDSCTFDSSFEVYAQVTGFTWTFTNCTKDGTALTADNFKTLFSHSDVWTGCTCTVDGTTVVAG